MLDVQLTEAHELLPSDPDVVESIDKKFKPMIVVTDEPERATFGLTADDSSGPSNVSNCASVPTADVTVIRDCDWSRGKGPATQTSKETEVQLTVGQVTARAPVGVRS